jgi:hypothetical protein
MIKKVYTPEIVNIVDVVRRIVDEVRSEYDPSGYEKPYFMHGHPLEIINTLKEYTLDRTLMYKKFPLIALYEDIKDSGASGIFSHQAKLNILIVTDTDINYVASDRYNKTFNEVLTPIFDLFVKHYQLSREVFTNKRTAPDRINHLFWGKAGLYGSTANFFEDAIDAIEIENLDFKVYR